MDIQQLLLRLFSPEYITTAEDAVIRAFIVEVISLVLARMLVRNRVDPIKQLPDDVALLLMESRYASAWLLLTTYTIFEEALFFGVPIWLFDRILGLPEYKSTAEYIASQLWSILHLEPTVIITLTPMAILKASLWLSGYWWVSTLWHIAHNTIAYIIVLKEL